MLSYQSCRCYATIFKMQICIQILFLEFWNMFNFDCIYREVDKDLAACFQGGDATGRIWRKKIFLFQNLIDM